MGRFSLTAEFPAHFFTRVDTREHVPLAELIDVLNGNRVERYRFELLDGDDNYKADLVAVLSGSIEKSIYNTIRSGGTLEIVDDGTINFYNDRVRVYYGLLFNGAWVESPLGVFLLTTPGQRVDGKTITRSVQMYDKLLVLDQDAVSASYSIAAGGVVTDAVAAVIQGAGETKTNITPSSETLPAAKTWPAGTTRLRIVNDLLSSINYFSLWADGNGYYRAEPYVAPASRPVSWAFEDNDKGLYLPDFEIDVDLFNAPNKIICVVSNPEQGEMTAVATNEDASSPFSYQSRGRWISRVETVDATSQGVLQSTADRLLKESLQTTETIMYDHAFLPQIELNDAVKFVNSLTDTNAKYTVVKQSLKLAPGSLVKSEIRRVLT